MKEHDRAELKRNAKRNIWDRWATPAFSEIRDGWLQVGENDRIYAPQEHRELVSQLAALDDPAADDGDVLVFGRAYGRLGYLELSNMERAPQTLLLDHVEQGAPQDTRHERVYDEPLDWIRAHAATINWCLQAAKALEQHQRADHRAFGDLFARFPTRYGLRNTVQQRPGALIILAIDLGAMRPRDRIGRLLGDTIFTNLRGVRRRVEWQEGALVNFWGGSSLLESIYTMLADAVTGSGTLATCETTGCGRVFIRTHAHQRNCPPNVEQGRSPCLTRRLQREYRVRQKRKRMVGGTGGSKRQRP